MGKHKVKGAGGKRSKSKPKKFGEETKTVSISTRIPISKSEEFTEFGQSVIKPLINKKIKTWEVNREKTDI